MIPRYQSQTMHNIWSDHHKFATWFAVEVAYLDAYLRDEGTNDLDLISRLKTKAAAIDWRLLAEKIEVYERDTHHDVIAFLQALEEEFGTDSRLIHVGLTSSDIVDTAFALMLRTSCDQIEQKLDALISALWVRANEYKGVPCLGRTHGQSAEGTTFGIKLLGHMSEFARARARLRAAREDISVGKFSGAVGVYGQTKPSVEKSALASLGLKPETVATQVIARDRHAHLFSTLAILAGSIERFAVEIRLLMHGQVREVSEPFGAKQKGSSAMPHKKNPVLSENLTGLARLVRSYAHASLENQALWHERDISHSSVERVIAPDAFHLVDFALTRITRLAQGLVVDSARMKENLAYVGDILCSQSVMLALVKKGMLRKEAYELVQKAALSKGSFKDGLVSAGVLAHMNGAEFDALVTTNDAILHEACLFDRAERFMNV